MKRTKTNILTIVALGSLLACGSIVRADDSSTPAAPAAPATPPPGGGQRGQRGGAAMQKLIESLDLTADQKPKVMDVLKDQREKMTALRDDSSLTREEKRPKMKEITDATDAKLKTILTADQYTKWEEGRKAMRQNGPGGPGNGPKPGAADPAPKSN